SAPRRAFRRPRCAASARMPARAPPPSANRHGGESRTCPSSGLLVDGCQAGFLRGSGAGLSRRTTARQRRQPGEPAWRPLLAPLLLAGAAPPRFAKQRRLPLPSDLGAELGMHLHDVDRTWRPRAVASGWTAYLLRRAAYLWAAGGVGALTGTYRSAGGTARTRYSLGNADRRVGSGGRGERPRSSRHRR